MSTVTQTKAPAFRINLAEQPKPKMGSPYPIGVYESLDTIAPTTVETQPTNPAVQNLPSVSSLALPKEAATPAQVSILNSNRNLFWPEFEIEDQRTEQAFGYFVVPIITLGHWSHDWYGEIDFTEADFDQLKLNFSNRAAGYEPALYVGHPEFGDGGGRAAAGFLEVLVKVEDVLWGIFAAVDEQVYMDVKKGKYRYSSAELTPETIHRQSGLELGLVLTGCALTNEPFLTNMPPVRVFNNSSTPQKCTASLLQIAYPIHDTNCVRDNLSTKLSNSLIPMTTPVAASTTLDSTQAAGVSAPAAVPSTPTLPTPVPAAAPEAAAPPTQTFSADPVATATLSAIASELAEIKRNLSQTTIEVTQLKAENLALTNARAADVLAMQLSTVEKSTLTAASKLAFSAALKSGLPAANAAELMNQVQELSNTEQATYLTQHGATGTAELAAQAAAAAAEVATAAETQPVFAFANYLKARQPAAKQ
jgi:hypothetical protein